MPAARLLPGGNAPTVFRDSEMQWHLCCFLQFFAVLGVLEGSPDAGAGRAVNNHTLCPQVNDIGWLIAGILKH